MRNNSERANAMRRAVLGALMGVALVASGDVMGQATPRPPERLTYQGYVAGSDGVALGNAATKNYDVIFRIYGSDASDAAPLWGEQQTVTVDKGYFSVLLGEGAAVTGAPNAGVTLSSLFTGATASDRYVGFTVKGIGTGGADVEILPRVRLMASPYAFLASRALAANTATKIVQDNAGAADLLSGSGSTLTLNGRLNVQGNNILELGAGVAGKEPAAGTISYGGWSNGDSLDIVGAGTTASNRKIRFYSEGGAFFNGPVTAASMSLSGGLTVPTLTISGEDLTALSTRFAVLRDGGGLMLGHGRTKNYPWNGFIGYGSVAGVDQLTIQGGGIDEANRRVYMWADGGFTISGPTIFLNTLRIHNKAVIDTGANVSRCDAYAGMIGFQAFSDGLDIVGAGPAGGNRRIVMHSQGTTDHHGNFKLNGVISAYNFAINSDRRIKDIVGLVDGRESLEAMRRIRVTDYRLKAGAGGGGGTTRGVIAQELKEVLPQAVTEATDVVPDINESGVAFSWEGADKPMQVTTTQPHRLAAGERVRLEIAGFPKDVEVESVRDEKTFAVRGVDKKPEAVRVVGREVKDFMRVDYQQVQMTALRALQQLDVGVEGMARRLEAASAENKALAEKVKALEAAMAASEAKAQKADALQARIELLEQAILGGKGGVIPVKASVGAGPEGVSASLLRK